MDSNINLPNFCREKPEVWFLQCESKFRLRGIADRSSLMYDHVMEKLPFDLMEKIVVMIRFMPTEEPYQKLRKTVLKCLTGRDPLGEIKREEEDVEVVDISGEEEDPRLNDAAGWQHLQDGITLEEFQQEAAAVLGDSGIEMEDFHNEEFLDDEIMVEVPDWKPVYRSFVGPLVLSPSRPRLNQQDMALPSTSSSDSKNKTSFPNAFAATKIVNGKVTAAVLQPLRKEQKTAEAISSGKKSAETTGKPATATVAAATTVRVASARSAHAKGKLVTRTTANEIPVATTTTATAAAKEELGVTAAVAPTLFSCDTCHKSYSTKKQLSKHQLGPLHRDVKHQQREDRQGSPEVRSEVPLCSSPPKGTKQKNSFPCDVCNKQFFVKRSMGIHRTVMHGKKKKKAEKCEICNKSFVRAGNLRNHVSAVHGESSSKRSTEIDNPKEGETSNSNSNSSKETAVKRTMDKASSDKEEKKKRKKKKIATAAVVTKKERKLLCEDKGERKKKVPNVKAMERKYVCEVCDKRWPSNHHLDRHVYSVHLQIKRFECQHCQIKFYENCKMMKHIRKMHQE